MFTRYYLITCWLLLAAVATHAQQVSGMVTDAGSHQPLFPATVVNLATEQSVACDVAGHFSIAAHKGDIISFSFVGYGTITRVADPSTPMQVALEQLSVQLKGYTIRPDFTPYQKDSADLTTLYSKQLHTTRIKPKVTGLQADGLIASLAQKVSRSYKRDKRFQEHFRTDLEQKYIDTRYTPGLVTALTGFGGDTLAMFMNTYPMEYGFARTATDLEVKMWIRSNYKSYLHSLSASPARLPDFEEEKK